MKSNGSGSAQRVQHLAAASLMVFLAGQGSAYAGDILRLKSAGDVRVTDSSRQILMSADSAIDRYFVVQFQDRITEADKADLVSKGIEIKRYLPEDALLVKAPAHTAGTVGSFFGSVRAVTSFRPEWKISPELFSADYASGGKPDWLLVSTFENGGAAAVLEQLQDVVGVRIISSSDRDIVVDASYSTLYSIAQIEGVEWIQRLPIVENFTMPMTPAKRALDTAPYEYTGFESGTKIMNFDAAWNRGYTGAGQIVTVADTGLDSGNVSTVHPDFVGTVIKGYASGLGGESWKDPMGHGTHVAGSVASNGRQSDGKLRGGAHGAKLIAQGLWSDILDNLAPGTDFNRLLNPIYNDGSRIHTNSWGSPNNPGEYDTMASRVDEYMWNHPEMLVLFAAGNSGEDLNKDGRIDEGSVSSPGTAKNVLTVGASENYLLKGGIQRELGKLRDGDKKWGVAPLKDDILSNNPNGMAAFSSRGPTKDKRLKPEIVAPGTNIISTRSKQPGASPLWGEFNADYVYAGGTSMATPLTAGAAAVAREYLVKSRSINSPSAALVKATLMHTAFDMYPGQYGTGAGQELPKRRPNIHEGYGRVDMDYVTRLGSETMIVDDTAGVAASEQKTITISVPEGATFRATLVYTDAPSSSASAKTLVNDLDLKVTTPSGQTLAPQDRVNNNEIVEFSSAKSGTYQITVSGQNVPQGKNGKQPYALVVGSY